MARKRPETSWHVEPKPPEVCVLCGREAPNLTDHHLVPKSQGRRQGVKLGEIPTVKMCPACQGFLTKTFSNAELANDLNTVEALLARLLNHPAVRALDPSKRFDDAAMDTISPAPHSSVPLIARTG